MTFDEEWLLPKVGSAESVHQQIRDTRQYVHVSRNLAKQKDIRVLTQPIISAVPYLRKKKMFVKLSDMISTGAYRVNKKDSCSFASKKLGF